MTVLSDGRVLLAGGMDEDQEPLADAELWDPTTGRFTPTGNMRQARGGQSGTLLADGRVLIIGGAVARTTPCPWNAGLCPNVQNSPSAEIFDPATGKFSRTGSLHGTSNSNVTLRLADGKVLVAAQILELYEPTRGALRRTAHQPKWAPQALAQLANGQVLILESGYVGNAGGLDWTMEVFDPTTETLSPTAKPTDDEALTLISPVIFRPILIETPDFAASTLYVQSFEYPTGAFGARVSVTVPPAFNDAIGLPNGDVLILESPPGIPGMAIDAYLLNPATGVVSALGRTAIAFQLRSEVTLPDGQVLFCGGNDGLETLAACQLFMP
jgi:hypothetical protein